MDNISTNSGQALNGLLSFVEKYSDTLFWVQTAEGDKQFYLGEKFVEFYQRPCQLLFDDPKNFFDLFTDTEQQKMIDMVDQRYVLFEQEKQHYEMHTRVALPDGGSVFSRDISFQLYDANGMAQATLGAVTRITEQEYKPYTLTPVIDESSSGELYHVFQSIFDKEFGLKTFIQNNTSYFLNVKGYGSVLLPLREAQCLQQIMLLRTSKMIAKELGISFRTVQSHCAKLKSRYNFPTVIALVAAIENRSDVLSWQF